MDASSKASLVLLTALYQWSEDRWTHTCDGDVSLTSDRVTIRSEKGVVGDYPLLAEKYWDLKPHCGSDRGWTCTVLVGENEEQRVAFRFKDEQTAKRFKEVLSEYRKALSPPST